MQKFEKINYLFEFFSVICRTFKCLSEIYFESLLLKDYLKYMSELNHFKSISLCFNDYCDDIKLQLMRKYNIQLK